MTRIITAFGFILMLFAFAPKKGLSAESQHKQATIDVEEVKRTKRQKAAIGRPISNAEIYAVAVRQQIIKTIDQTLLSLEKTASKLKKKSEVRLEVKYKILNLNMEQAAYVSAEEFRNFEKVYENWKIGGKKGPEPKIEDSRSRKHWSELLRVADELNQEFPTSSHADDVLYNQALALMFLGKEKEAARAFTELITKFKNSPIAGDAYFSLGDYYFDRNDYRNAISNYQSALRYRKGKRYGWALFKSGWSYYNLGKYSNALDSWKKTVMYARNTSEEGGARLKEEAMRDMVFAFAELKQVDQAIAYYRANDGLEHVGPLLSLLASIFSEQGEYEQAIAVLKRYQTVSPGSPDAPKFQLEICDLNFELNKYNETLKELETLANNYGPKSTWAQTNAKDQKLVLETEKMITEKILYYAKVMHKHAQKDNNKQLYTSSKAAYTMFLQRFPDAREIPEVKYNLADIEYFSKNYRASGGLYLEIASLGPEKALVYSKGNQVINIHHDAAKFMLDAYLKDFENELQALIKTKPNFDKPPKPLSIPARNFVKSCHSYQKWYPKDEKNNRTCDIYLAEVYYRTNDKKNSLEYLWIIASKYPGSKEGNEAVENLIPIMKDDQKTLLATVDKILKIPAYQTGKIGEKLRALQRRARLEDIKSEKDQTKRAQQYFAESQKNPTAEDADALMYNAGVDFEGGGDIGKAITAYSIVATKYPKFGKAQFSMLRVARLNDQMFKLAEATKGYEIYLQKYPKDKDFKALSARICEIDFILRSKDVFTSCSKLAAFDPATAKDFFISLAVDAYRQKQLGSLVQLTSRYLSKNTSMSSNELIVANYRIYDVANGSGSEAANAAQQILSIFKKNPKQVSGEALRYVGEMTFRQVDGELAKFLKVGLVGGTVEKLLGSIQTKAGALDRLEAAYKKVTETQDSYWGVAALNQIATANEDLANKLDNPPGINGASIADIKKELAPKVEELRQRTRKLFGEAHATAQKYDVYSPWAIKVLNGLNRNTGIRREFAEWILPANFLEIEAPSEIVKTVQ